MKQISKTLKQLVLGAGLPVLVLLSPKLLLAQRVDTLHRELTVVSDREVVIDPKSPLNPAYKFDNPKVTRLQPVKPRPARDFTPPIVIPRHPALSDIATRLNYNKKRGFVSFEGGFGPNILVDAGIYLPIGEFGAFVLDARHSSTVHETAYQNSIRSKVKRHTTDIALGYQRRKGLNELQISGEISHDRFNYFGLYIPSVKDENYNSTLTSPIESDGIFTSVEAAYKREGETSLLKLDGILNTTLQKENRPSSLDRTFSSKQYHLTLKGYYLGRYRDFLRYGAKVQLAGVLDNSRGYGLLRPSPLVLDNGINGYNSHNETITPFIGFEGMNGSFPWHIDLGVGIGAYGYVGGGYLGEGYRQGLRLIWHPYVDASLTVNQQLSFFLQADGGIRQPNRFGDDLYNRFIAPGYPLQPEHVALHTEVGADFNVGAGLSFQLSGGYDGIKGKNFLSPALISFEKDAPTPFIAFFPYLNDADIAFVSLGAQYSLHKLIDLSASVSYRHYTLNPNAVPQGIVPLEAKASLTIFPVENLSIYLDGYLGAGVRFQLAAGKDEGERSLTFTRFTLGANYRLNSLFALHASLRNPTFTPQEFPLGYADTYPLAFSLGASILF